MEPKKESRVIPAGSLSAPDISPANRRRAERTTLAKPVTLLVDSDRSQIAHGAFGIDLSELGIRVRSSAGLLPGQLVNVVPNQGSMQAVPSRVIWVGEEGSSRAGEAGIAFLEPLTLEA
jgi:PilZ domain-containing protein